MKTKNGFDAKIQPQNDYQLAILNWNHTKAVFSTERNCQLSELRIEGEDKLRELDPYGEKGYIARIRSVDEAQTWSLYHLDQNWTTQ